jgi:puromycin-sensitive aminopeptidase
MWEQFVYSDLNSALELDALENSHPIEVPIYDASEVDEMSVAACTLQLTPLCVV